VIKVVSEHHFALAEWACYRRKLESPPALLTFDYHTDTLMAFGHAATDEAERQGWIKAFDYRSDQSIATALQRLRHDEHIDLALRGDVVSRALIVAHAEQPGCANERIQVVCDRSWPKMQELLNDPERFKPLAGQMFESDFLRSRLQEAEFETAPGFIFDLDLDYLLLSKALKPNDRTVLNQLLRSAGLITVSLESDWVDLLKLEADLSADSLCEMFMQLYKNATITRKNES
jgi:hypothetical protein